MIPTNGAPPARPRPPLLYLMMGPWFGHGRATELFLTIVCALYAVILLITPDSALGARATWDLAYAGFGRWIALPFAAKACFSGIGLYLNIIGHRRAWLMRFIGAALGSMLWTWYAAKLALITDVATLGFVFCLVSATFSVRIMGMALAGLPKPGAPGVIP